MNDSEIHQLKRHQVFITEAMIRAMLAQSKRLPKHLQPVRMQRGSASWFARIAILEALQRRGIDLAHIYPEAGSVYFTN
jgi:hypothetical protein